MAKIVGDKWVVLHEATNKYLVTYDNGKKGRFHSFISDSWASEAEALAKAEELVKSHAIPPFTYKAVKSR